VTPPPHARAWTIDTWRLVRLGCSALLVATAAIHLDLYLTGYNTIPTIGWLFLVQVISALVLAALMIVSARRVLTAISAGFLLSTFAGYLLSLHVGLFGFREVRTRAGIVAGVIETVGFAALMTYALRPDRLDRPTMSTALIHLGIKNLRMLLRTGRWSAVALTVLATLSLAFSLPSSGATSISGKGMSITFRVARIRGVSVLTNAHGYTLYWFAPDTPTASNCTATCAAYWPPVIGSASAQTNVTGTFTTVKRSNGAPQITYDGHPLYTYVGDSAPGQANGNHIKLNGGWWYEMKVAK
jgi:predicted lipoprotein with Yx(FWY)xxD motif